MGNYLTHLDPKGGVRMVDVGDKPETGRTAMARGRVYMKPQTLEMIAGGDMPKGDVLSVAQVAGITGAKKASDLIPLCHPLGLSSVNVTLKMNRDKCAVEVESQVRVFAKTGAEMEALSAVTAACLTIYDMCKAVDRAMEISDIRLVLKSGGKSGTFLREDEGFV